MIVGHKKQWEFLKSAVMGSRVAHGYLFSGRPHLGKMTMAFKFACLLNCWAQNPDEKPCGKCRACRMMKRGTHPDFILLQRQEGRDLKVRQVEILIRALSLRASFGGFKIGIIDRAHLMNRYAQNAILKTLEEPHGKTVLIMIADSKELLLPTILSRLQEIKFFPVSIAELNKFFQKKGTAAREKEMILRLAMGRPGKVVQFLERPALLKKEQERVAEIKRLLGSDLNARFKFIKSLEKDEPFEILISFLRFLRKSLLNALKNGEDTAQIMGQIRKTQQAVHLLRHYNVNKKITLQNLMIHL